MLRLSICEPPAADTQPNPMHLRVQGLRLTTTADTHAAGFAAPSKSAGERELLGDAIPAYHSSAVDPQAPRLRALNSEPSSGPSVSPPMPPDVSDWATASGDATAKGGAVASGGAVARGGAVISSGATSGGDAVAVGSAVITGGAVTSGGAVASGGNAQDVDRSNTPDVLGSPSVGSSSDGGENGASASPTSLSEANPTPDATDVIGGMVEAFQRRSELRKQEVSCLLSSIGALSGSVMTACQEVVALVDQLFGSEGTQPRKALKSEWQPAELEEPVWGIQNGLVRLIQLQGAFADRCTKGGPHLDTFDLAASHLRNLSYVSGRLIANGADIAAELTDAVAAFREKDWRRFGMDVGVAWRKVLLSNSTAQKPAADAKAVQATSRGIIEGFFGGAAPLLLASADVGRGHGPAGAVSMEVDTDACVAGNDDFFRDIWEGTWIFFAQLATESWQQNRTKGHASPGNCWQGLLAVALIKMPGALRRCGLSQDQEAMLLRSLKALQGLELRLDAQGQTLDNKEVSVNLLQTVEDWQARRWREFGKDLGKLLQELVILVFPQEYTTDYSGRLQRQLEAPAGGVQAVPRPVAALLVPAVAALMLLVTASVQRSIAACSSSRQRITEPFFSYHLETHALE